MSTMTSLGRALAVTRGRAHRVTTVRHLHVSATPIVFVPLRMAGEAGAPMAALIGTDRADPRLLVVAQPRNRDQRFAFAHELAKILLADILRMKSHRRLVSGDDAAVRRCVDAPQIWVPNRAGVEFVRLLGRSTRFRKKRGPWPVPANVPEIGKWLTFYADRQQYAGSSLLVPATAALSQHWATGQSPEEDEHLGTVLAWIEPGDGLSGVDAAQRAEDPIVYPPAGPATDPTFDNTVLAPLISRYHDHAHNPTEQAVIEIRIADAVRSQLIGTWQQVWHAIELLRALDPGANVPQRWARDLDSFTRTADWIADSGDAAQPRRDSAVAAARRLHDLEREQSRYDAERAFDDPLIMAEARLAGEAFVGTVTAVDPYRCIGRRKVPLITIETADPVRLPEGEDGLRSPARPQQKTRLVSITEIGDRLQLVLELSRGMGSGPAPAPGSVPDLGEETCYSLFNSDFRRPPTFPPRDETPWTHGGPPEIYIPTDDDAQEEWE